MMRVSCHMTPEEKEEEEKKRCSFSPHECSIYPSPGPPPPSSPRPSPLLGILHEDRLLDIFHSVSKRCSEIRASSKESAV